MFKEPPKMKTRPDALWPRIHDGFSPKCHVQRKQHRQGTFLTEPVVLASVKVIRDTVRSSFPNKSRIQVTTPHRSNLGHASLLPHFPPVEAESFRRGPVVIESIP